MIEVRILMPSGRKKLYRNSQPGVIIQKIIEQEFYNQCYERFDMSREEVNAAIHAASIAFTAEDEQAANADRLYQVFNGIIDQTQQHLKFFDGNSYSWAKLGITHR